MTSVKRMTNVMINGKVCGHNGNEDISTKGIGNEDEKKKKKKKERKTKKDEEKKKNYFKKKTLKIIVALLIPRKSNVKKNIF